MALLAVCLATLAGCATSTPSRFYTLTPVKGSDASAGVIPVKEGTILALGPVRLPEYLDRPQIATRSEGNEVRLHETERWAGSLQEDVSRVLNENLSALLAGKRVVVIRWTSVMQTMIAPFRYRLAIEILRFEGTVGGTVVLKARYGLLGPDGKTVISAGESTVREPAGGTDYEALVAAMSRALAAFSREIAAAIPAR
ncbi:MAG TPA: PqiC family protein [Candidatus Deferrimicrobiaceae bacterium]